MTKGKFALLLAYLIVSLFTILFSALVFSFTSSSPSLTATPPTNNNNNNNNDNNDKLGASYYRRVDKLRSGEVKKVSEARNVLTKVGSKGMCWRNTSLVTVLLSQKVRVGYGPKKLFDLYPHSLEACKDGEDNQGGPLLSNCPDRAFTCSLPSPHSSSPSSDKQQVEEEKSPQREFECLFTYRAEVQPSAQIVLVHPDEGYVLPRIKFDGQLWAVFGHEPTWKMDGVWHSREDLSPFDLSFHWGRNADVRLLFFYLDNLYLSGKQNRKRKNNEEQAEEEKMDYSLSWWEDVDAEALWNRFLGEADEGNTRGAEGGIGGDIRASDLLRATLQSSNRLTTTRSVEVTSDNLLRSTEEDRKRTEERLLEVRKQFEPPARMVRESEDDDITDVDQKDDMDPSKEMAGDVTSLGLASAMVSVCNRGRENWLFNFMSLVPTASYSRCLHNSKGDGKRLKQEGEGEDLMEQKIELVKRHPFHVAIESNDEPGFVTEKVYQALFAGSIPIYVGNRDVFDLVPRNSFLYAPDYPSITHLAEHILQIATNKTEFLKYHSWRTEKDFTHSFFKDLMERGRITAPCRLCQFFLENHQSLSLRTTQPFFHPTNGWKRIPRYL
jgi:hypothetical protein